MSNTIFSIDGENFYDFCHIESDLYDIEIGDIYYTGEKVSVNPEDILDMYSVDNLLTDLDCSLFDELNNEDADYCFQDVTKEEKEELLNLLKDWTKRYVKIPYWSVRNIEEVVVTKEDWE